MIAELVREAGTGGRARRAAALAGGRRRGDGPPRGAAGRQAVAGRARQRLRRAVQPEGHHHRPRRLRLREVGTTARTAIEALLGQPVYLDLHVKIAKDWQRDPKQLQRLGF